MTDYRLPAPVFQSDRTRRIIIASYWAVVLLALPLWWFTTSIQRLPLPEARIRVESERNTKSSITIFIDSKDKSVSKELETRLQSCDEENLSIHVYDKTRSDASESSHYTVLLHDGSETPLLRGRRLSYGIGSLNKEDIPGSLAEILCGLIAPPFSSVDEHRTVQYSSEYRLAFSLLNEDASAGKPVIEWDIELAVQNLINPTLLQLSPVHNFSVESQVQLQAPLAFQPIQEDGYTLLSREQLTIFVNSAEWSLASGITNDPVLHFIIYIPSTERRPVYIEGLRGDHEVPHSFIVPRWGGIVIYNPVDNPTDTSLTLAYSTLQLSFAIFRSQLLQLLGVPQNPLYSSDQEITQWHLDALQRRRARENIRDSKEALESIIRLVNTIESIPVGKAVQSDVDNALVSLEKIHNAPSLSPELVLSYSADAMKLSSRAFFHPSMLAMLYFPAEHTYAVYLPLFLPALTPLAIALIKEFKAWRKESREKLKTE